MKRFRICRIIPTRVGTRISVQSGKVVMKDHPHACGDKSFFVGLENSPIGSSPRVWGQGWKLENYWDKARIIPTRMGTSCSSLPLRLSLWDHPHAYGDKHGIQHFRSFPYGSSPRVWGQVKDEVLTAQGAGIIPTRMGTSNSVSKSSGRRRDHPHAYGDKTTAQRTDMALKGSSPRVWGQEASKTCATPTSRIIPTRMGTRFGAQKCHSIV